MAISVAISRCANERSSQMIRRAISFFMVAAGMLMLVAGLGAFMPLAPASAQSVPQPTPRPALPPDSDGKSSSKSTDDMGHITGTVIDQLSNAPIPNATVRVGDQTIIADANGNYDLWIAVGTYTVGFVASNGTIAQTYSVDIPANTIVIRHLSGTSAAPAIPAATAIPTSVPAAVIVAPTQVAPIPEAVAPLAPARLPRTAGNPLVALEPWFWVSLGIALLVGGLMIASRADSLRAPARALANYAHTSPSMAADAAALLAALLTTEIRAASPGEDTLLQALLNANTQRRRAAQEILADLLSKPLSA
jgi:hypothetical protein